MNVDLEYMTHLLNPNVLKLKSKGIDSVKARVMNLKERFPDINPESVITGVTEAFYSYHGMDNQSSELLSNKELYENEDIKEVHSKLTDEGWILGECAKFSNGFETRFDWGTIELQLEVDKGFVIDCKIYSDSLFPDLIDQLETAIRSRKPAYRSKDLSDIRRDIDCDTETQAKYVKEFFDWIEKVMNE